jgi:hypothetical protein
MTVPVRVSSTGIVIRRAFPFVRSVPMFPHDPMRGLDRFRQHIEEHAHALGLTK